MDKENEQVAEDLDVVTEEEAPEEEESEPEPTATTDWEARAKRLEEKAIAQRERTRALRAEVTKLRKAQDKAQTPTPAPTTGESDVEALLLEVKGIQDPEQVALFEQWKTDTGRGARSILSNPTFQKELAALKAEQAVKAATPSGTKRGGNQTTDISAAIAKFEATGDLPEDFDTRTAVVNALAEKTSVHVPGYRKR